jgi:hypothetical protein
LIKNNLYFLKAPSESFPEEAFLRPYSQRNFPNSPKKRNEIKERTNIIKKIQNPQKNGLGHLREIIIRESIVLSLIE